LTTTATLLLELSLTRIFSVVFYYHFAFLAISIALFGLGAGGVLSYYFTHRGRPLYLRLGVFSSLAALVATFSVAYILSRNGASGFWELAALYFAAAAPFILSGMVISLAVAETIRRVDRVYFFDLLGAAMGCLLLIPMLNLLGGPGAVLIAALLLAAASATWFGVARSVTGRIFGVALSLSLMMLIAYNKQAHLIDIRFAKDAKLENETFVQWNSFSRIAVRKEPNGGLMVSIDADATTGIAQFDIDRLREEDRRELSKFGPAFVYKLRPAAKTLIIGAGGGWDVARALASGSKDVTGVEINPIIARTIMQQRFRRESRDLYLRPDVRIFVEDGRSFIRRSNEQYQVLQATLVDTWASTAAGAFALSENNLYTTEAFIDYFTHLTPGGVLSFTRWGFSPPRESLRLVSLARAALERLGEREVWRHVIVVREESQKISGWGATDTVLISRKPFTDADLAKARESAAGNFEIVYLPGATGNPFADLLRAARQRDFYARYRYDVSPVPDDRPFFFYTVQPRDVFEYFFSDPRESADSKVNLAVPTLFWSLGVSLAATIVTLLLPPILLRARLPRERGVMGFLPYFACLGAGYILIQVGLIQKLVLFLGHPTYAITVAIFSMLVASGAGSYFSRRLVKDSTGNLLKVLYAVGATVALLAFLIAPATYALTALPMGLKMLVTVLLIAPAAFLMGMPFPSGLASLEAWHPPSIRWAWSLNAAASVLGSGFAIFCAIYAGLRNTLLLGAALYLLAALILASAARRARQIADLPPDRRSGPPELPQR
jgi:MFS family permease